MANTKIDELYKERPEAVLTISQLWEGENHKMVRAPLPDGFGMSVGSSFTDPNNIDAAGGAGGKSGMIMRGLSMATGVSTKIAQNSNVFFGGPEPSEISFEINFSAYYSAFDEVVLPVAKLMAMSVGWEKSFNSVIGMVKEKIDESDESDAEVDRNSIAQFLQGYGFVHSPGTVKVKFGKTLQIPRAYVSSVGPKFSNVLDNQGLPMSADVSVTIKVVRNPTQPEVLNYFKKAGV